MNKVIFITGGTSGIGKATATELAKMGYQVIISARNEEKGIQTVKEITQTVANADVSYMVADFLSLKEIRKMAEEFKTKYNRLDVLINNAGAIYSERVISPEGYEGQITVNHLSHFLLTGILLPLMLNTGKARIINVSSQAHKMGKIWLDDLMLEKEYSGIKSYGQAKLANILFTYELARRIQDKGITVNCLHPGGVNTGFDRHLKGVVNILWKSFKPFLITPEKGAETSVYLAVSDEVDGVTGKYFIRKKQAESTQLSRDAELAKEFWQKSEELTGFVYL
jgi:NAD(P)-dependent dehydrogenase (short-subunit alcohol dehydrogenase family)